MRVQQFDPSADPRWAALLERAGDASVFCHPAWLSLLARQYRYDVSAVAVSDGDALVAGIPLVHVASRLTGKRLVAVPFSDACPPVLAGGEDALAALGEALVERRRSTGLPVEVRWPVPQIPGARVVPRFLHHRVALGADIEEFERGLKSAVRRNIKKARRSGVTVRAETGRAGLETFYRLHLLTRRRQGVPTQPKRFILGIEELFRQGLGFVLVAEHAGHDVAAAVYLGHGDTMIYKYGASDERALDVRPNNLLFLEAIRRAGEQGLSWLDFGRTDFGHEGLRTFKLGWGAEEAELAYTYLSDAPPRDGDGRMTELLGAVIRRSPPWVGGAIGTALYRHVG